MDDSNGAKEVCLKEDKILFLCILLTLTQNRLGKENKNCSDPETASITWHFASEELAFLGCMGFLWRNSPLEWSFSSFICFLFSLEAAKYGFLRELQDKRRRGDLGRTPLKFFQRSNLNKLMWMEQLTYKCKCV